MERMNERDSVFDAAMDQMFKEVGFKGFDREFVKQDEWYTKRTWTENQERAFKDWLVNECRTKMKWSKKIAETEAAYFLLMWGWSTAK